jgi:inhibitor of cysteine peptidase
MQPVRSVGWIQSSRYFLLVALLAAAFYPKSATAETKVVTDADKGSKVHLKVGDTLEVRLNSNPTTGYMWYVHKASTPLMKLVHQSQTEPAAPGVGRPVVQVFTFEPRRAGDGVLLLHYVRAWEKPDPDEEQFTVHVVIE